MFLSLRPSVEEKKQGVAIMEGLIPVSVYPTEAKYELRRMYLYLVPK